MRNKALFWTLPLLALLIPASAPPAEAGVDAFHFGAGFRVGDFHFRVGYAEARPWGPSYYFEAARPLPYRRYACSGHCSYRAGRHYHHPTCPLVRHHFARHGYAPDHLIAYYGPRVAYPPPVYYGPPVHYAPRARYPRYYGHHRHERYYWKKHRHHVPPGHRKHGHHRHHRGDDCYGYPH